MKISTNKTHKSIRSPLDFELPKFSVLTGENGAGKTHLFEAITTEGIGTIQVDGKTIKKISYLPFNTLNPTVDQRCDPNTIAQKIKKVWTELTNLKQRYNSHDFSQVTSNDNHPLLGHLNNSPNKNAVLNVCDKTSTLLHELTEDIIADNISMSEIDNSNLFNTQFALIFKAYHVRYLDNLMNKVMIEEGTHEDAIYLSVEEFCAKYGPPPWDFVNDILERLELPYVVNNPMANRRDTTFLFNLVHKDEQFTINTNDLSTGEKTLMSLALAIYNSTSGDRAEMLILDEPDAPLHPSMSKLMLEILEEDIVKKHGIPVLISTHSTTTIACTPVHALYKLPKSTKTPEKCELDDTISLLTHGIPNLRVSIESRRQVFVEHKYDVYFYENLFRILEKKYDFPTLPYFLPPHNNNGSNCTDTIAIATKLKEMGNNHVYGLIDWDLTNDVKDNVITLGGSKRYAIENYIFEPHIVGLYLLDKRFTTSSDLGLAPDLSYFAVCKLIEQDASLLQTISNSIQSKLDILTGSLGTSTLLSGVSIQTDSAIFTTYGHDLEAHYKTKWPKLNSIRNGNYGDSALKLDIIGSTIHNMPDLLSVDIVETFRKIT